MEPSHKNEESRPKPEPIIPKAENLVILIHLNHLGYMSQLVVESDYKHRRIQYDSLNVIGDRDNTRVRLATPFHALLSESMKTTISAATCCLCSQTL